ncbi:hypothetical protein QBC34DRAFT_397967 [Podospora aff. communis PSN243]|uniref:Protein kinase domain-containing protein n=1 Tax=Podospora aff. communis PSN243 TaxID=3040156 RepID=A0AAV9GY85_9PEZI|nr:hypothetical protein QBC34DRAFT_397967 [Podospora aff. communis PSN243]
MSVELALGLFATVDLCFKYGKELKAVCSSLRNADAEIAERVLRLDNGWLRLTHQLNFLRRVQHMMEEEHREVYEQTLRVFLNKLQIVTLILRRLVKPRSDTFGVAGGGFEISPKKLKFALQKNNLDKAIEELEVWQRTADHSWFLLMKIADPQVDEALDAPENDGESTISTAVSIPSTVTIRAGLEEVFLVGTASGVGMTLKAEELQKMSMTPVPHSDSICLAERRYSNGDVAAYILNHIQCEPASKYQIIKKDTRDLARKLQHDEPDTFGLLNCKGFVTERDAERDASGPVPNIVFTLVFRAPTGLVHPRTLRQLLTTTPLPDSLTDRLDIAKGIAKSVSYVHTFGFVHKNVRPEAFMCFSRPGCFPSPGGAVSNTDRLSVYLVGFENFRREEGRTHRKGDDAVERNLYRHPSRQGSSPREDYIMQHDIYSLGVCLLEVGLWSSFVDYPDVDGSPTLANHLGISEKTGPKAAHQLKEHGKGLLLSLAKKELRQCMGSRYAEIVETCLTCLDPENADFGDETEFEDEDGICVGVRYIEKVLLRLNTLSV